MLVRKLKLRLNKSQTTKLEEWLWCLTGVYNFGIRKIELSTKDKIYYSKFNFQNLLANHGKRLGIPSHTLQGVLTQSYDAWDRCFKKVSKKPRLKGRNNKLNSIPFPDSIKNPEENKISLPIIGRIKYHKQEIPEGKIKCGRIIKKPSGWYLCLWIDTFHSFSVKETEEAVGVDPGFNTLLTLSNGTKIENPRELRKGEKRLAQAQRGKRKKLSARLHQRQANRRQDRNHKISRRLLENYQTICYSKDELLKLAKTHGKSVTEGGLGQLTNYLTYKSQLCGRKVIYVDSKNTTLCCSTCGALSGPSGEDNLQVRQWNCACGACHDRDINAAINILHAGLGWSLGVLESSGGAR